MIQKLFSILFVTCSFITQNISAQCSWIRGSSETIDYSADAWGLAFDDADNYYVAGAFREDFTASGISFSAPTKGQGYFVAKYDTDGNIIWGKVIEAFAESNTRLPRIHRVGERLYLAGASVAEIMIDGTSYGNEEADNVFLIGMNFDGGFDFINTFPDSAAVEPPYVAGITHNQQNNIYITGSFSGYLDWGPFTATSSTPTTFIAMFNSDGNILEFDKTSSPGSSQSRGWPITVDGDNNLILGGHFQNTLNYSPCVGELTVPTSDRNPYIMKMDSALHCEWVVVGDGVQEFSTTYGLVTDAENNIYACGNFNDSISFNGVGLTDAEGTFFIIKIDTGGTVLWAKAYGDNATTGQAVSTLNFDAAGNLWLTGWHAAAADFGSVSFSGTGVFAVKLDADGNPLEGVSGDGLSTSYPSIIDNSGNLIIAGAAEGDEINFEGDGYEYSTNSSKGFFILRYYLDSDSCSADTIDIA
ncbi:MAG: hypothetical protein ACKVPJ_10535, partial [Chitinophagales bacterium]